MIFDDLMELLKASEPDIEIIKKSWIKTGNEKELEDLEKISSQEGFWQHPDNIKISKQLQQLKAAKSSYDQIINSFKDNLEIINLMKDSEAELKQLEPEIKKIV